MHKALHHARPSVSCLRFNRKQKNRRNFKFDWWRDILHIVPYISAAETRKFAIFVLLEIFFLNSSKQSATFQFCLAHQQSYWHDINHIPIIYWQSYTLGALLHDCQKLRAVAEVFPLESTDVLIGFWKFTQPHVVGGHRWSAFVPSWGHRFSCDSAIFLRTRHIHIRAVSVRISPKLHTLYVAVFAASEKRQ